jgi:hypothetical protein
MTPLSAHGPPWPPVTDRGSYLDCSSSLSEEDDLGENHIHHFGPRRQLLGRRMMKPALISRVGEVAIPPVPRRGLSRGEAATYIGVSVRKFDEMVEDGRMPAPKRIDSRKIWDVRSLDLAFDALPSENGLEFGNSWNDV